MTVQQNVNINWSNSLRSFNWSSVSDCAHAAAHQLLCMELCVRIHNEKRQQQVVVIVVIWIPVIAFLYNNLHNGHANLNEKLCNWNVNKYPYNFTIIAEDRPWMQKNKNQRSKYYTIRSTIYICMIRSLRLMFYFCLSLFNFLFWFFPIRFWFSLECSWQLAVLRASFAEMCARFGAHIPVSIKTILVRDPQGMTPMWIRVCARAMTNSASKFGILNEIWK